MKRYWFAATTVAAVLTSSPQISAQVLVAGFDGEPTASSVETSYQGPPLTSDQYDVGNVAQDLCMALFVQKAPFDVAKSRTLERQDILERFPPELSKTVEIDQASRKVTYKITGYQRTSKFYEGHGCSILPTGLTDIYATLPPPSAFTPVKSASSAAEPVVRDPHVNAKQLKSIVDAAFDKGVTTEGIVVVHDGKIVAERYRPPFSANTYFQSWSAGKSLLGTLIGVMIEQGEFELDDPAPIALWHKDPTDPRRAIKVRDLLQMSSGLLFSSPSDPPYKSRLGGTSDHELAYSDSVNAYNFAITAPLEKPPGSSGRYRNSDMWSLGLIAKQVAARHGMHLRTYLQRYLYDPLGIEGGYASTDAYGNIVFSGMDNFRARNWAKIAQLYLRQGQHNGQQIIPASFVEFVRTRAPGWNNPDRPLDNCNCSYGGTFWLPSGKSDKVTRDTIAPEDPNSSAMLGGEGSASIFIIPSLDLVIVWMGDEQHNSLPSQSGKESEGLHDDELKTYIRPLVDLFERYPRTNDPRSANDQDPILKRVLSSRRSISMESAKVSMGNPIN